MGLIGVLAGERDELASLRARNEYGRVQAIALPGTHCAIQRSRPECSLPEETKEQITRALGSAANSSSLTLNTTRGVYLHYPDLKGAAAFVLDSDLGEELLFFFGQGENGWNPIPVTTILGLTEANGGIVFRTFRDTGIGEYMHDSAFFVLPDLDQNGGDEVLLVSMLVSRFFSIEPQYNERAGKQGRATKFVVREVHAINFSV